MEQTPELIRQLLGCPLQQITRSYWAVKLENGTWICEAGTKQGREIDWATDLVATGDCKYIVELWLLCPPSRTSPLGNTARLPITRRGSAFQMNLVAHDIPLVGNTKRNYQAQIIGRIDDEEGNCTCFAFDIVQDGLITPDTQAYDSAGRVMRNEDGSPFYPLRTNVRHFGWRLVDEQPSPAMWRPNLAPLPPIALDRLGASL